MQNDLIAREIFKASYNFFGKSGAKQFRKFINQE
jgi:hypothetical protein